MLLPLLFVAFVGSALWIAGRSRRRRTEERRPVRLAVQAPVSAPPSLQALCELSARALDAHVAILVPSDGKLRVAAGAPSLPQLQVFDTVAADWAIAHQVATGRGSGVITASDWQFRPVFRNGMLCGLIAFAGRLGRDPVRPEQTEMVEDIIDQAAAALHRSAREACRTSKAVAA